MPGSLHMKSNGWKHSYLRGSVILLSLVLIAILAGCGGGGGSAGGNDGDVNDVSQGLICPRL